MYIRRRILTDRTSKLNWQNRFSTTFRSHGIIALRNGLSNRILYITTLACHFQSISQASQFHSRFSFFPCSGPFFPLGLNKTETLMECVSQSVLAFFCWFCFAYLLFIIFSGSFNFEWRKRKTFVLSKYLCACMCVCNLFALRARIKRPFSVCLSFAFSSAFTLCMCQNTDGENLFECFITTTTKVFVGYFACEQSLSGARPSAVCKIFNINNLWFVHIWWSSKFWKLFFENLVTYARCWHVIIRSKSISYSNCFLSTSCSRFLLLCLSLYSSFSLSILLAWSNTRKKHFF